MQYYYGLLQVTTLPVTAGAESLTLVDSPRQITHAQPYEMCGPISRLWLLHWASTTVEEMVVVSLQEKHVAKRPGPSPSPTRRCESVQSS